MGETVASIVARSVYISSTATLLSAAWSLPLAYLVARGRFRGLGEAAEALVGVPTVLIGLLLYLLLSRNGPLGGLGLLYTPTAIIIGEAILVTPLLLATSRHILEAAVNTYGDLALALGADERSAMLLALREAAPGLVAAVVMGFSRAVGELGVALMVGGNIKGYTRTITTTIALEVSKGEYETALALGAALVAVLIAAAAAARLAREWWKTR